MMMKTMRDKNTENLVGYLLVGVPNIEEMGAMSSVIYIFSHSSEDGAMGLVLDTPISEIEAQDFLAQHNIPLPVSGITSYRIGGQEKGYFLLHSSEYSHPMSQKITEDTSLIMVNNINTAIKAASVWQDLASGFGPQHYLSIAGYTKWEKGQIEDEIMGNLWLIVPATPDVLFNSRTQYQWQEALKSIGIDANRLSGRAGKA